MVKASPSFWMPNLKERLPQAVKTAILEIFLEGFVKVWVEEMMSF